MKARNFSDHFGRVGAFDIYTSSKYKNFVLVTATCHTASPMVRWAAKILTEATIDFKPNPINISIGVYDACSADKLNTFTCVSTIIPADPKGIMTYFQGLNLNPPADCKSNLDTSNLSVGPCAYRDTNGLKYVKVRMSGYSVPFVLAKGEATWDRTATKQAILKNQIGGYVLDQICNALENKSTFIMERAKKRPLNLSMIDEYAKHNMTFYREPKKGIYEPAVKTDLADPEYKPVIIFELGNIKYFAMIEDRMYRIRHFLSKKVANDDGTPKTMVGAPYDASDGYFQFSDCIPLSDEDTFTLDKIKRCLENKL